MQGRLDNSTGLGAILLLSPHLHPDEVRATLFAALALKVHPRIVTLVDSEDRDNWDGSPPARLPGGVPRTPPQSDQDVI